MVMSSLKYQKKSNTIKFLCSYGGKILPRYPDGKLRYHGGETRVLSVHRSISFSDLLMKTAELYGAPVNLRCQLPSEDLDALISITSDEDLENLIEEYDRAGAGAAPVSSIRSFLSLPRKRSISSNSNVCSSSSSVSSYTPRFPPIVNVNRCNRPPIYPNRLKSPVVLKISSPCAYHVHNYNGHKYLVHNGNYRK